MLETGLLISPSPDTECLHRAEVPGGSSCAIPPAIPPDPREVPARVDCGGPRSSTVEQGPFKPEVERSIRSGGIGAASPFTVVLCVVFAAAVMLLAGPEPAHAAGKWQGPSTATWYGPGFYGNTTACGQRYGDSRGRKVPRGVAHMTLPCGAKLTIRWRPRGGRRWRVVRVRVIDTGAFGHEFDLSASTARDLCRCSRPFTLGAYGVPGVRWKRGWTP